ncbi:MAG TPA: ABC transporter permease, partial [Thermoanaerobaculia bacterium]|nr:ABC transporter permease [Thermoanaerobaculia bacterium]
MGGTARAALASIALGVMAMVIAMALMSGYRNDLEQKLVAGNAAVVAYPLSASGEETVAAREISKLPGVTGVERVAFAEGSLSRPSGESVEVTLRGTGGGDRRFGNAGQLLSRPALAGHGVVLGRDLADRLGVQRGDALRLMALGFRDGRPMFRYRTLIVAGTFASGFSEFDRSWAVLPRRLIEGLSDGGVKSDLLEISVADVSETSAITA